MCLVGANRTSMPYMYKLIHPYDVPQSVTIQIPGALSGPIQQVQQQAQGKAGDVLHPVSYWHNVSYTLRLSWWAKSPSHHLSVHTCSAPTSEHQVVHMNQAKLQKAHVCLYWNSAMRAMWSEDHVSFGSPGLALRASLISDSSGSSRVAVGTSELVVYST